MVTSSTGTRNNSPRWRPAMRCPRSSHSVTIEYRWSDTQNDRLPALAADLVRRQVAVLAAVGDGPSVVRAVQAITTTLPIVSAAVSADTALTRPGGNVTGATGFGELGGMAGKKLGLLHELVPRATTIAALAIPAATPSSREDMLEAARVLAITGQDLLTLSCVHVVAIGALRGLL